MREREREGVRKNKGEGRKQINLAARTESRYHVITFLSNTRLHDHVAIRDIRGRPDIHTAWNTDTSQGKMTQSVVTFEKDETFDLKIKLLHRNETPQ